MFAEHPSFETPPDGTSVWRYVPLVQLLDGLSTNELHFSKLEDLGDPWEGHMPAAHVKAQAPSDLPDEFIKQSLAHSMEIVRKMCVSCWHMGEDESEVLWHRYAKESGVAIESTVGRLKAAITSERKVYIGKVEYINYDALHEVVDNGNLYNSVLCKRRQYSADSELRLLAQTRFRSTEPVRLAVRIDQLICRIHTSPRTPDWAADSIERTCRALKYEGEIRRSKLSGPPPS